MHLGMRTETQQEYKAMKAICVLNYLRNEGAIDTTYSLQSRTVKSVQDSSLVGDVGCSNAIPKWIPLVTEGLLRY